MFGAVNRDFVVFPFGKMRAVKNRGRVGFLAAI